MASSGPKEASIHTNAPAHWPKIDLELIDHPGMNAVIVGAELAALSQPPASTVAFVHDFLYDDGILRVPILVEEGGQKTCVFLYSGRDEDAAAHYAGVSALLRSREKAAAVYYAPQALPPVPPGPVLQSIDTSFFSKVAEPLLDARFALWWSTDEAPKLADSEERASIDRWFEATDGYGFLFLTAFLKDLELVEGPKAVHALPPQPLRHAVMGPGETPMLLHASESDGLFLAFDRSTSVSRRRVLLRLLADFAAGYRRAIEARRFPALAQEKGRGLASWRARRDEVLAQEASGAAGLSVYAMSLRDGRPS